MKAKITALIVAFSCATLAGLYAQETAIRIVYVSKMPDIAATAAGIGGLSELGSLLLQTRKTQATTLFFHGGDSLAPSAMSLFDRGTHMIEILNGLAPDAMAVNEREFTFKENELVLRAGEAAFPFICSNILDPLTGGNLPEVADDALFDIGGFRIGAFAVIDPLVSVTYLPDRIRVKDVAETIAAEASKLRRSGADIVVLLSGFAVENLDRILAEGTVDIVLESSSKEDAVYPKDRGIHAKQGTASGKAAILDLALERKDGATRSRYAGRIVSLIDYPPDAETKKRIDGYRELLASFMGGKVGTIDTPLDTAKHAVRTAENAFGNLVADALRAYYGADIGLVNGGSIRGERAYPAGTTLTRQDIQTELPFPSQSRFASVTGAQLVQVMENSFSQIEEVKGRFLQVSGLTVAYNPIAPVGSRVRSVMVGGRPVKSEQRYTIATLDFLLEGGDGFEVLMKATTVKTSKSSLLCWELVRHYIEQKRRLSPRVEGRLVVVRD
ncbi:MAG: 5'-nucleotidase C-terminal domain-containing protein [Spirochaetaceae bacterium]|nr:5'-nucleotidase C-terminal domain-containing protein [Spirochaetaceae bacterium]